MRINYKTARFSKNNYTYRIYLIKSTNVGLNRLRKNHLRQNYPKQNLDHLFFKATIDFFFLAASVIGFGGLPWMFIIPVVTHFYGRKISFMLLSVNAFLGYIVFYCSSSPMEILISEIIQGMSQACLNCLLPIIITEYTSSSYRGVFLTIKSASFFWGLWVANAIGTFYYWKNIGILALVCSVFTLTVFVWPESPIWLATKGRYEECAASYKWLKGCDEDANKELEYLINSQKEYAKVHKVTKPKDIIINFFKTILSEDFFKPVLLCIMMMSLCHLSGKLAFNIYAIRIIKKLTDNESLAYRGMLILDGVTVLGMYIGCGLSKFLKRKTQLLVCSSLGVLFLFILSIYLYLVKLETIAENDVVSLALLVLVSLAISCGPMIMSTSIYGEIVPLRFKSAAMFVMGFYANAIMATVLKVAPFFFKTMGLHGACLFYAVSSLICIIVLYKYLPETKDKSLKEIEAYFSKQSKERVKELSVLKNPEDSKT